MAADTQSACGRALGPRSKAGCTGAGGGEALGLQEGRAGGGQLRPDSHWGSAMYPSAARGVDKLPPQGPAQSGQRSRPAGWCRGSLQLPRHKALGPLWRCLIQRGQDWGLDALLSSLSPVHP